MESVATARAWINKLGKESLVATTSSLDGMRSSLTEYERYRCRHYKRGCDLVVSFIAFWIHDTMLTRVQYIGVGTVQYYC